MPDLLRRFIVFVSRLAPSATRRDFRAEWEAELASSWQARPRRGWRESWRVVGRALGSVPDAWFLFRQQWSVDMLLQDVRYALRLMRQRPGYTAVVIVTLALGIGANTAMFSAIHGVLLRPLPFGDPTQLVQIWENDRLNRKPRYFVAPANFDDWRRQTRSFEHVAAFVPQSGSVSGRGEPFHARAVVVTPNFFAALGVAPALGRSLTDADGVPPNHRVLILSHAAWLARFAGDANVIDTAVQLGGTPYRIVGVMPRGFAFPDADVDLWRPAALSPELLATRAQHFFHVIGRIKPGISHEAARDDLERVAIAAQKAYPQTNDQRGTTMVPLQEAIVGDVRRPMYALGAAVALLLLIACANVANLMLAQGASRRREMAVRTALGADRFRLARQLLVEGLILAVASGAAGIALAAWGTRALARVAADYVPRAADIHLDLSVLAFALALSLGSGVLLACVPALRGSRANVQGDLREGARGSIGGARWMRNALVVVEVAAAVVLVVGGALLLKSFWRVLQVQPGFTTSAVLSIDTELPPGRYDKDASVRQFYADFLARLSALPGVHAAAVVNNLPLSGQGWTAWLTIENAPRLAGEPPEVGYRVATPGYLAAMQIPLLQGRWFSDADTPESLKVVAVNKALADRFFRDRPAIGARIRLGPNPKAPWRTIVGVTANVHHEGPEVEPAAEAFEPFSQDTIGDLTVVVRADGDRSAIAAAVRATARSIDPAVALWRMQWMDGMMDERLAPRRLAMLIVEGFAAVALALALLGIYGVMSYAVTQRVAEIGVRMALGAGPAAIHRMVIRDGLWLAVPGLLAGGAAALLVTRFARGMLFDVSPTDPLAFATVGLGMLGVALMACYVPARRAARVDPLSAIRDQ
jgi:putative ABC transport system permease protein